MKRILAVVSTAAVLVACNPSVEDVKVTAQPTPTVDTTGLAAYQAWKAQNELAAMNNYNNSAAYAPQAEPRRTYSAPAPRRTSTASRSSSSGSRSVASSSGSYPAQQKKGWSKAAKGAAIGAGTGAVAGAIINKKNRVAGGVIGGVVGAGVGYGIGRGMDKRDGRY